MTLIYLSAAALGIYFVTKIFIWWRQQKIILERFAELKTHEAEIEEHVRIFEEFLSNGQYFANYQYEKWKGGGQRFSNYLDVDFNALKTDDPFKSTLIRFLKYLKNARTDIDKHNKDISKIESDHLKVLLEKRKIFFNHDQLMAAVSEEDNTLVVAGAGTGKTTTILGKLSYLIDRLRVAPQDILLLSFTGKAVEELQDRVKKHFPEINIEVRTFHSFGLSVLGRILGSRPSIAFEDSAERQEWVQKEFEVLLRENSAYLQSAINYFAFYLTPHDAEPRFNSLDEYWRYVKTEKVLTFQKELVKSQQEAMIANFLYLYGINYIYEHPYKISTADQDHRQYHPDFYLPDYDIYIEHFGIDRAGHVHFVKDKAKNAELSRKYQEEIRWKQGIHTTNKTKLIETFSYEFSEHIWEQQFIAKLENLRVPLKQRSPQEVLKTLRDSGHVFQIVTLFLTFLDLAKANHYFANQLEGLVAKRNKPREIAFINLFLSIYKKYEGYLEVTKTIDFHDMLNRATELINEGKLADNFKYVIIDEFQDFSVSKNQLVRALCGKSPETKLFCVGDDWQSIFRFAGSDVSLMTNFEKYHGYTDNLRLTRTNRFDSRLAAITNVFIMKNPHQIRKEISATHTLNQSPLEIEIAKSIDGKDVLLSKILDALNQEASKNGKSTTVMLLGRYKFNKPKNFETYKKSYRNLQIDFLTIHRSKGLEADYVIILDVIEGKYGFPSNVTDDPILEIVLSESESFPHAEERRLMYVALTRARKKVFIMTLSGQISPFVLELEVDIKKSDNAMICPQCSGIAVQRRGPYGDFYGCSNFPQCRWKRKNR